ncbi:MAG: nicotinate phosphoribosyltransferase [Chloroflexi bacterium]|nr:MAG: nicotinate phosphoribosyltransferase [Chloroflexota bacterium]
MITNFETTYSSDAEAPLLSRDLDFYKLTMGDMILEKHPDDVVTFTMKNRNSDQPLAEYVDSDTLATTLDAIRRQGFTNEEIAYYGGLKAQDGEARFTAEYLDHIAAIQLPEVKIANDPETNDLAITTSGPWADVSLWETVVMSEVNEAYYKGLMESHGLSLGDLYAEGDLRLNEKIALLATRPDIKFSDFGTRRRFSADWHEHVIQRLTTELPDSFVGTSNPWFAYKYDLRPIGTFAHELPMVYAGIADQQGDNPLDGHSQMLYDWQDHHRGDLSIALPDTFGSEFFFEDFTREQAIAWNGLRHDSGDPIAFGERAIELYRQYNIDPMTKTIVFSDGLNINTIIELADYFTGKVTIMFGWGTSLMNDLGLPANNFVMKATEVNGTGTVKLSDDPGKHTGSIEKVSMMQQKVAEKLGMGACQQMVSR